jgi:hypothetical protein
MSIQKNSSLKHNKIKKIFDLILEKYSPDKVINGKIKLPENSSALIYDNRDLLKNRDTSILEDIDFINSYNILCEFYKKSNSFENYLFNVKYYNVDANGNQSEFIPDDIKTKLMSNTKLLSKNIKYAEIIRENSKILLENGWLVEKIISKCTIKNNICKLDLLKVINQMMWVFQDSDKVLNLLHKFRMNGISDTSNFLVQEYPKYGLYNKDQYNDLYKIVKIMYDNENCKNTNEKKCEEFLNYKFEIQKKNVLNSVKVKELVIPDKFKEVQKILTPKNGNINKILLDLCASEELEDLKFDLELKTILSDYVNNICHRMVIDFHNKKIKKFKAFFNPLFVAKDKFAKDLSVTLFNNSEMETEYNFSELVGYPNNSNGSNGSNSSNGLYFESVFFINVFLYIIIKYMLKYVGKATIIDKNIWNKLINNTKSLFMLKAYGDMRLDWDNDDEWINK